MNNFKLNTTLLVGLLVLSSCLKEDTEPDQIDPNNTDVLTKNLIMPSGSQLKKGDPPPPSGISDAPVAINLNSEIDAVVNAEFTLPIGFSNVSNSITGIYLQIDGAGSYYTIPVSSFTSEELEISIDIGLPSDITNGRFCMSYCGFDENGQISNIISTCVSIVETLPEFPDEVFPNNVDTLEGDQLGLELVANSEIHETVKIELSSPSVNFSFDEAILFRTGESGTWDGVIIKMTNKTNSLLSAPEIEFQYKDSNDEPTFSVNGSFKVLGSMGINVESNEHHPVILPNQTFYAISTILSSSHTSDVESIRIVDVSCEYLCQQDHILSPYSLIPMKYQVTKSPTIEYGLLDYGEIRVDISNKSNIRLGRDEITMIFLDENNNPIFGFIDKYDYLYPYIKANDEAEVVEDTYYGFLGSSTKAIIFTSFDYYED